MEITGDELFEWYMKADRMSRRKGLTRTVVEQQLLTPVLTPEEEAKLVEADPYHDTLIEKWDSWSRWRKR